MEDKATRLPGYKNSLSHLLSASLREAYQDPPQAHLFFDPIPAIVMKRMPVNIATALEGRMISTCMQGRSKSRVMREIFLGMLFFCLVAICKTRAKKVGYGRSNKSEGPNVDGDRWTKHARSGSIGKRE